MTWTKESKTENVHLFVSAHNKKRSWITTSATLRKKKLFSFSETMIMPTAF